MADYASITGGYSNRAGSPLEDGRGITIAGGIDNSATGEGATVSGGIENSASGEWASVSGGQSNAATGRSASVTGGRNNEARGDWSTVTAGGGPERYTEDGSEDDFQGNLATTPYCAIHGGYGNQAGGSNRDVHTTRHESRRGAQSRERLRLLGARRDS